VLVVLGLEVDEELELMLELVVDAVVELCFCQSHHSPTQLVVDVLDAEEELVLKVVEDEEVMLEVVEIAVV
jgi:hypothetical protein